MPNVRPLAKAPELPAHHRPFTEVSAWSAVGSGWRPLFGSYRELGFSLEWHDFTSAEDFDWARSFHPGSVELCLNLEGQAVLTDGQQSIELSPRMVVFYFQGSPPLEAVRRANEPHRFVTVEFSAEFLEHHFCKQADNVHPLVRAVVRHEARASQTTSPEPLGIFLRQLIESLRNCPVFKPAQEVWFRSKALEVAAHVLFRPPGGELLCTRAKRAARERVERVRADREAIKQKAAALGQNQPSYFQDEGPIKTPFSAKLGETGSITVGNAAANGSSAGFVGVSGGGLVKTESVLAVYILEE